MQLRVPPTPVDKCGNHRLLCATLPVMRTQRTSVHTSGHPGRWRRLNAAALVLWRGPDTAQIELGENRIMIRNVRPEQLSALLARPAHATTTPPAGETVAAAALAPSSTGPIRAPAVRLAEKLYEAGFLTRRMPRGGTDGGPPAYLSADFGAMTGRYGDAAFDLLRRRREAVVSVHGSGRISATIASTLAAAGVGQVHLVGGSEASAADSCPGGLVPSDEGRRFGVAGPEAIRRASPDVDTGPVGGGQIANLVVLTDPPPIDPAVRDGLHLDSMAHLAASVDGSRAVIGPLVVPGRTSCLRCADLIRGEHDPCWPLLAVQLAARPRHRAISDVALCVAAAGAAAGQALSFLDGQRAETLSGTMEWQLPDWRLRRRSWPPHHDCDCGAAGGASEHGTMEW